MARKKVLSFALPSPVLEMLNALEDDNVDDVWLFFDSGNLEPIFSVLAKRFPEKCECLIDEADKDP